MILRLSKNRKKKLFKSQHERMELKLINFDWFLRRVMKSIKILILIVSILRKV